MIMVKSSRVGHVVTDKVADFSILIWNKYDYDLKIKPGAIVGFGNCWEASRHLGEGQVRVVGHQVGKKRARQKVDPSRLSKTGAGFLPDCTWW